MIKAFSFLFIGFFLLLAVPLCIGVAGGVFGLVVAVIGGIIGLFFGLIGFIFKSIAWIFSSIMHVLFGWHSDFGFHPWHWHFNGYLLAALVILIIAISQRTK
jgi:hypothetical protein